jgi:ribonuclease BN (tRNA processing enzyme)
MRLTVLGGGAAGATSQGGCSGYLLRSLTTTVVIDLGPDTLSELRRQVDLRHLDGIIISHMHLDHTLDLATLRGALVYSPQPFGSTIVLYLPPGGAEILSSQGQALDIDHHSPNYFGDSFDVNEYNPMDSLRIGDITLDFAPAVHPPPTWAMRIRAQGDRGDVGYTSDTGPSSHLESFFADVRLLVCESTLLEAEGADRPSGHLTASQAGSLARVARAEMLVLTHNWEENGYEQIVAEAQTMYGGEISIARPGLTIHIA